MNCKVCNKPIAQARIEHFQSLNRQVNTCVHHSSEEPTIGLMTYGHKTAGYVTIVPKNEDGTNDPNKVDIAFRAYKRSR